MTNPVQTRFIAFLPLSRFIAFLFCSIFIASCTNIDVPTEEKSSSTTTPHFDTLSDLVKIGEQIWTTKNLDVVTFRNGDTIPEATSNEEWEKAGHEKRPAWCYYDNDPKNGEKYGKLYNWYAVNDTRDLAPKGYHVPSKAEWDSLVSYLGGEEIVGKKLKSTEGWLEDGNGTNESGFSGLAGGNRNNNGLFLNVGSYGSWWSSTEFDTDYAWFFNLNYYSVLVFGNYDFRGVGLSIRCLRD